MKEEIVSRELGLKVIFYFDNDVLKEVKLRSLSRSTSHHSLHSSSKIKKAVQRYFDRKTDTFSELPLDLSGYTAKERKILEAMRKIPFGKTVSYKELAVMAGNSSMSRFVGNVCKKNRFPLIIPCHRVIKSDGTLGGYSAGLTIKKKLLKFEE